MTFDHSLVTIYNDTQDLRIGQTLSSLLNGRDVRVVQPQNSFLDNALRNSILACVGICDPDDTVIQDIKHIQTRHKDVCNILAFVPDPSPVCSLQLLSNGFDSVVCRSDINKHTFQKYLECLLERGAKRQQLQIKEEQYRRLSDALSIAPVSMIVFDADKRAVFVSDHYFRAYPKIAPRLIQGLRVYDAFHLMADEERLYPSDPRYEDIKNFWYALSGTIQFTLDNGRTYRLKAVQLPANRGTIVTGQNISSYV